MKKRHQTYQLRFQQQRNHTSSSTKPDNRKCALTQLRPVWLCDSRRLDTRRSVLTTKEHYVFLYLYVLSSCVCVLHFICWSTLRYFRFIKVKCYFAPHHVALPFESNRPSRDMSSQVGPLHRHRDYRSLLICYWGKFLYLSFSQTIQFILQV